MNPKPCFVDEPDDNVGARPPTLDAFPRRAGGLISPKCRSLLDYWRGLPAGPGGIPHRRSVDPVAIGARLLPHIFLCEYLADGVLVRLQGSYLSEQAGQTMTGRRIDGTTFGANAGLILALYDWVRTAGMPLATHETVLTTRFDVIPCEVLHLPLRRDRPGGGTEIGYVLGALDRLDRRVLPRHDLHAKEFEAIQIVEDL